ncbi:40S ribosomal protein S29-like [Phoca vitulina]|uniref:40S ribosomal protein S29-like n=1 Tax=Phoca vitulina TaxID=9720 RepID=UPI001395E683|nr:40S ribosomal protein S29-like [Phoca vitulina]
MAGSTSFLIPAHSTSQLPWEMKEQDGSQQLYWSHPRKFGQGSRSCRVSSNRDGLIRKYGLNMWRRCFRQSAKDIGFIKLD